MNTFHQEFERVLTSTDTKQNIPFAFQVPAGTTQLKICLSFTPWKVEGRYNLLTLSVFDPDGFRGAGHRHGDSHEVVLNSNAASPGYRPGHIQAGEWKVVIDTHMIMPGVDCPIHLEIVGTDGAVTEESKVWQAADGIRHGAGWYRGDLHAHSIHSDASWDIPDLLEWAREHRLDFCTLSDHNTVSGLAQVDALRSSELMFLGGMELTTFWGHALALGLREWVDWRVSDGKRTMAQIASEVQARGGLFIIAHPRSIGDPECTGCRWVYETMMPGNARAVEVWNDPWTSPGDNNEDALALVFGWLNQGYRLALTSGTDNHGRNRMDEPYGFDVVYAQALSEPEILRAVREGHLYLSSGPRLELTATVTGQSFMMGDSIQSTAGQPILVKAKWSDCPSDAEVTLIVDGVSHASTPAQTNGSQTWTLNEAQAHWCLVTMRAADGRMLALTNAIYLDGRS